MFKRAMVLTGALSAMALAAATPSHAAVTFGSANVHSNALASSTAGANGNGNGNGANADVSAVFTPSLNASAYGNATTAGADFTVEAQGQAFENASATFASPSSGTINFSGRVSNTVTTADGEAQGQDNGEYYNYLFDVSTLSNLQLTYAFSETYGGVNNSYILIDETSGTVVSQLNTNGNISGAADLSLAAGEYALAASTEYGDFAFQSGIGSSSGSHDEAYTFNITSAAPEPTTWMLMISGLAGIGVKLRRTRRSSGSRLQGAVSA